MSSTKYMRKKKKEKSCKLKADEYIAF